jgi:hypothetical protein
LFSVFENKTCEWPHMQRNSCVRFDTLCIKHRSFGGDPYDNGPCAEGSHVQYLLLSKGSQPPSLLPLVPWVLPSLLPTLLLSVTTSSSTPSRGLGTGSMTQNVHRWTQQWPHTNNATVHLAGDLVCISLVPAPD